MKKITCVLWALSVTFAAVAFPLLSHAEDAPSLSPGGCALLKMNLRAAYEAAKKDSWEETRMKDGIPMRVLYALQSEFLRDFNTREHQLLRALADGRVDGDRVLPEMESKLKAFVSRKTQDAYRDAFADRSVAALQQARALQHLQLSLRPGKILLGYGPGFGAETELGRDAKESARLLLAAYKKAQDRAITSLLLGEVAAIDSPEAYVHRKLAEFPSCAENGSPAHAPLAHAPLAPSISAAAQAPGRASAEITSDASESKAGAAR